MTTTTATTTIRPEEQLLLRVETCCALINTSRTSFYRAMKRGEIETILINGSQRRVSKQALLKYIEEQRRRTAAEQK